MKQQFYGHFLATRIFHLATAKKIQSPLGARIKKLISDPEILFLPLENEIHIFMPPCNILYLLHYLQVALTFEFVHQSAPIQMKALLSCGVVCYAVQGGSNF